MGVKGLMFAGVACGGATILVLMAAVAVPLGVFYLRISDEYADHKCNDPVDPFDLAYWLHIQAWNFFGSLCACFVIYVGALSCFLNKWLGGIILVPTGILMVAYGLFQCAWTIIGMVEVARASECHMHAPELWNWCFAAVLINTLVMFGCGGGGAGAGGAYGKS